MATHRNRAQAFVVGSTLFALACQDDFPLGSWGQTTPSSTPTTSSTASGTTTPPPPPPPQPSPTCGEAATPVPLTTSGTQLGTTNVYTNWTWPAPIDSLEWDLVIETDPPNDGYYWLHQFSFVNSGTSGFLGLQAHGGYTDPANPGPIDFTKMAVFWISGPPTDAELGDFTGKNGRKAQVTQYGVAWMTIHGKFEWSACHVYHLKLGPDGTTDAGDIWYGAWITDKTTGVEAFLGRMLIPASWGQLQTLSVMETTRIDNAATDVPVVTCADPEPASAIFGMPTANDGSVVPAAPQSRFAMPPRCATSRYTNLPEGVRHELGVRAMP